MKSFPLTVSSPSGDLFHGEAVKITLRGVMGDLAVMAGHIPFVTPVSPCDCRIELEDGSERVGTVDGGILTVAQDKVTLLSGSFTWKE